MCIASGSNCARLPMYYYPLSFNVRSENYHNVLLFSLSFSKFYKGHLRFTIHISPSYTPHLSKAKWKLVQEIIKTEFGRPKNAMILPELRFKSLVLTRMDYNFDNKPVSILI